MIRFAKTNRNISPFVQQKVKSKSPALKRITQKQMQANLTNQYKSIMEKHKIEQTEERLLDFRGTINEIVNSKQS